MKEFLDPDKNYEFIKWHGISCAPENWIEVPDGAEILTVIFGDKVFYKSGSPFQWFDETYEKWVDCSDLVGLDGFGNMIWQREKESLNDKVASAEEFRKESIIDNLPEFKHNVVNHPKHYTSGDIECIDAIKASMSKEAFAGFLKGNIIKYMWRYEHKNGTEDLKKAQWYQNKLIELLS